MLQKIANIVKITGNVVGVILLLPVLLLITIILLPGEIQERSYIKKHKDKIMENEELKPEDLATDEEEELDEEESSDESSDDEKEEEVL